MPTNYPTGYDAWNNPTSTTEMDDVGYYHDELHANTHDAIEAIQAELGLTPSGSYATVKERLDLGLLPSWAGEWSSSPTYDAGNVVYYAGAAWLSLAENATTPPSEGGTVVYRKRDSVYQMQSAFSTGNVGVLSQFRVSSGVEITRVGIWAGAAGLTGTVTVGIYAYESMAGVSKSTYPSTAYATGTVAGASVGSSGWTMIDLDSPVTLETATDYLFRVTATSIDGLAIFADTASGVTSTDTMCFYANSGSNWSSATTVKVDIALETAAGWAVIAGTPPRAAVAKTDSYTLVLTDAGRLVEMGKATAQTLTVPTNSSVAFPVGTRIDVIQTGAGQVTVAGADGTVTVNAKTGLKISGQWGQAALIKRATNTWVLFGDLSA